MMINMNSADVFQRDRYYQLNPLFAKFDMFQNPIKPTCIDLIITNKPKSFQNSMVIETGSSDFHKICENVL